MQVTVRYFASIRETLGCGTEQVQTAAGTVGALRAELAQRSADHAECLGSQRMVRAAVDQVMCAHDDVPVRDGCEVAFFPPVTGG